MDTKSALHLPCFLGSRLARTSFWATLRYRTTRAPGLSHALPFCGFGTRSCWGRVLRLAWQPDVKRRSSAACRIKPNFASVCFHTRLGNGEPEPSTTSFLKGNKRVKHAAADLLRDTRPIIGNRDQQPPVSRGEGEANVS